TGEEPAVGRFPFLRQRTQRKAHLPMMRGDEIRDEVGGLVIGVAPALKPCKRRRQLMAEARALAHFPVRPFRQVLWPACACTRISSGLGPKPFGQGLARCALVCTAKHALKSFMCLD